MNVPVTIPMHYAAIHPTSYITQPQGTEMGKITNDLKRIGRAERYSISRLFKAFSQGQSVIVSNFEMDSDGTSLGRFRFVSSTLMLVDVDDLEGVTVPKEVLKKLNDKCAGLFFTFSHGTKGNRYRLAFQLSRPITDDGVYKRVYALLLRDLKKLGIPVDPQTKNPTSVIRTGVKGTLVNDFNITLDIDEYCERVNREQLQVAEKARENFELEMQYKTTFSELKEMAEKIGYIATGSGDGDLWKSIVMGIKHYSESGCISDSEGYELYAIISGPEANNKDWNSFRPSGNAKIATLIHHAKERGYKRKSYRYALEQPVQTYSSERHKVKEYIPTELAIEFILRKERLLIDSPTGSGKSTAFITASKKLASPENHHFFIFSVPTRSLAKQLANKHELFAVKGETQRIASKIHKYQKRGARVFVATYDMTAFLIDLLSSWHERVSFCLIVDEIHKYVTDYSKAYRYVAIKNLHNASKKASSFIGLSGTTEEVLKSGFDKIIKIENGRAASPCQEFVVYTYDKQKEAIPMLIKLIEAWTVKRKLLVYIQSKDVLKKLYDVLRKRGINTRTVSAAEKRNHTYKALIETEKVPDDVRVILATSVIADGLNIQNNLEWECLVVANSQSNMFNISMLKQCSNRFRNEYRRFSIFMQKPINKEEALFSIDGAYSYIEGISNRFAQKLNEEFSEKDLALFRASIIEKEYGLYSDQNEIVVDSFFLRHEASQAQEQYYKGRRVAFIKAVERILHKKCAGILDLNEEINNKTLDLSVIEKEISDLEEKGELDRETRTTNFDACFTKEVYEAFKLGNEDVLQEFKRLVLPEQYSCIERLHTITNFEVCRDIARQVKRKNEVYAFYSRVKNLVDVWNFEAYRRQSETKKVYNSLLKLSQQGELDKVFYEKQLYSISQKCGISKDKTEKVVKGFFYKESVRVNRVWQVVLTPLSFESLSERYSLEFEELESVIRDYAASQNKVSQIAIFNKLESLKRLENENIKKGTVEVS